LLRCTADFATLSKASEHAKLWYQSCDDDEHDVCHLSAFDKSGHQAGVVVMDGEMFEHTNLCQRAFTFIEISQITPTARDDTVWTKKASCLLDNWGSAQLILEVRITSQ
jgi:hypothetical protein